MLIEDWKRVMVDCFLVLLGVSLFILGVLLFMGAGDFLRGVMLGYW